MISEYVGDYSDALNYLLIGRRRVIHSEREALSALIGKEGSSGDYCDIVSYGILDECIGIRAFGKRNPKEQSALGTGELHALREFRTRQAIRGGCLRNLFRPKIFRSLRDEPEFRQKHLIHRNLKSFRRQRPSNPAFHSPHPKEFHTPKSLRDV